MSLQRTLLTTVVVCTTAAAHADVCDKPMLGPAEVGIRDSAFDRPRSACTEDTLRADVRGTALIDTPEFYGTLAGSLFVGYRHRSRAGVELEAGARLVDYRFVQNAVVTADEVSGGPIYFAGAVPYELTLGDHEAVLTSALRFDIPRSDTAHSITVVAASPFVVLTVGLSDDVLWHGRLAALLWAALPNRDVDTRIALAVSSDLAIQATSWLAFTAGLELQGGWYGAGVDHLLPRGGLRFAVSDHGRIELFVAAPALISLEERTDMVGQLGYTHQFAEPAWKNTRKAFFE